ncbi:MAG: ATP-binding protein [Campylobacterota bacterium]|nr:ATP-binding protein [Campylobacterota bacterium]
MNTNINKIVSDISKVNIIERILYEAILNSIHSESEKIECILEYHNKSVKSEFKSIKSITIIDDGVGFLKENITAFDTYLTELKSKKWGSKGTGRFSFLKLFKDVYYESSFKENNKNIKKRLGFSIKDDLQVKDLEYDNNKQTILFLKNPIEYQDINIEKTIERIFLKIYPTLALIKNKTSDRNLNIEFKVKDNITSFYTISLEEIVNLENQQFDINFKNSDGMIEKKKFELYYFVNEKNEPKIQNYGYCAGYVNVKNFDIQIKLKNKSYLFFLFSDYLNEMADDSRTDFPNIKNIETNLVAPISWEDINIKLKEELDKILYKKFPDIRESSLKVLESVKSAYPYLENLIDESYTSTVGYISQSDLLKGGYKKIDSIKDNIRKITEKFIDTSLITDKDLNILIKDASLDLAEYVTNRQVILDKMKLMIENNESIEDNIHNLIMPMRTTQEKENIDFKTTNLWLIDDKFMSFTNALSDKSIKTVVKEISQLDDTESFNGSRKEPDIVMYFNNDINQDKLITIELKSFSTDSRKKKDGVEQILDYIGIINKNLPNIKEKWYYLITTIDPEFRDRLIRDDYKQILSSEGGYFRYYDNKLIDSNVYVLDIESLITDSDLRNKAFMDIFKGGFGK